MEGKLYLFVDINLTRKFQSPNLWTRRIARPHEGSSNICSDLSLLHPHDTGIRFAEQPRNLNTPCSQQIHFHMIREANRIEHRPTKPITHGQPWSG